MKKKYPDVRLLVVIFFGPDFHIFGDSIDEIMASYAETESEYAFRNLKKQASQLLALESDDELNHIMVELAENQFKPASWGETWRSFLQKVVERIPD
jgi:hypothetical protein